jgi:hypothetical protein
VLVAEVTLKVVSVSACNGAVIVWLPLKTLTPAAVPSDVLRLTVEVPPIRYAFALSNVIVPTVTDASTVIVRGAVITEPNVATLPAPLGIVLPVQLPAVCQLPSASRFQLALVAPMTVVESVNLAVIGEHAHVRERVIEGPAGRGDESGVETLQAAGDGRDGVEALVEVPMDRVADVDRGVHDHPALGIDAELEIEHVHVLRVPRIVARLA